MKYFYSKKIQPSNYVESANKYEPFEIGVEADTFEEAKEEVQKLIRENLKELADQRTQMEKNVDNFNKDL